MGLKVAIVGMSPSCADAPWDDPTWEKWGLPWHEGYWQRMDRLFEMHDKRLLYGSHSKRPVGYEERLQECGVPLYMQEADGNALAYPFDDVAKTISLPYWNSSIAYAMALAIHEGAEVIDIVGVDMKSEDEYGYQRPNMEYLIGLAVGRGIPVFIADSSPLCKFQAEGAKFFDHVPTYVDRYGWLG